MTIKCFLAILITVTVRSSTLNRVITTLMHSKSYVKPTISNGKTVRYDEAPYLVSLKEPAIEFTGEITLWRNLCGGSIISRRAVLSAAHCFEGRDFLYARNPHLLRVVAGAGGCHDVIQQEKATAKPAQQWRKIQQLVIHEDYLFPEFDISLIRVERDFIYDNVVNFIAPASLNKEYYGMCKSAGFGIPGHTTDSKRATVVLVADIVTLPSSRCSQVWEMNMSFFICSKSAVTGMGRADSGGPLTCHDTDNTTLHRYLLTGIVGGQNFDNTTLYTRVSAYRDWILKYNGFKIINVPPLSLILMVINIHLIILYLRIFSFCTANRKMKRRRSLSQSTVQPLRKTINFYLSTLIVTKK